MLIVRGSLEKMAEEFKMEASQTKELLAKCRESEYGNTGNGVYDPFAAACMK